MIYMRPEIRSYTEEEIENMFDPSQAYGICLFGKGASYSSDTGCNMPHNYTGGTQPGMVVSIPITK